MLNFLYCLDENYNLQALNSINSLLNNCKNQINLFVIHKNPISFEKNFDNFIDKKNINKLKIIKFDIKNVDFPKLNSSHVSEATYYRLFIDFYLADEEIEHIVYLDSDIICLNNPQILLENEIKKMKKYNKPLAAKTEGTRQDSLELFLKLGLKNDNHFNAGVIIINLKKWAHQKTSSKLLKIMNERRDKIVYWDQDLLNIYFDDNYSKLNKYLNYNHSVFQNTLIPDEELHKICFLHYSGKSKPWDAVNLLNLNSNYYQKTFSNLGLYKYHITFKKTFKNTYKLLLIIFKLQFLKLEYPLEYLKLTFKALFKVN